ncbi:MAG: TonB-dependent receptor [Gammaproteobacteria bacterium]|nr:MAG: TonB-dependent receptor [Gammaproteobacteria bacterium]
MFVQDNAGNGSSNRPRGTTAENNSNSSIAKNVFLFLWLLSYSFLAYSAPASNEQNFSTQSTSEFTLSSQNLYAIEEVIVFGRGESLIGSAGAASEGAVAGNDLLVRPMLRVADLLEAVPGMIAAQHSGSGKANQYFLRGFNLDHGTDFTTYIEDVPWNLRTHGHGQGYLDVNGLIPETVERIDYRKGTYRASAGDFSMAGSGHMKTISSLEHSFFALETGSYNWGRIAGGTTTNVGDGELTLLGQYKTYDGPWQLPENLRHQSLWAKYSENTEYGNWDISLSGYVASWHPTEQTPESAFGSAECKNKFCSLDSSASGKTNRWILTSHWTSDEWRATLYGQFYDWHMLSNPTYEVNAQIDQFDQRIIIGGRYEQNFLKDEALEFLVGTEWRYDHIAKVGLNSAQRGQFIENISNNAVNEGSLGIYGEAIWKPVDELRLTTGLRGEFYNFDVNTNRGSGNSNDGHASDSIAAPKLGAAYNLNQQIELYANWGQGFHSNDARGVVNKQSPVPGLVRGTGYESGVRFEKGSFKITAAYWWLNLDSELIFVGDSNSVEPKGGTERRGYEVVAFWHPVNWIGIDAVYTGSQARNSDPEAAGGKYVEGGVEHAGELGIAATRNAWEFSARLRYLGPYPLLPDNSQRAKSETMLNLRVAYDLKKITLYGEVLNVLDHDGKDIVYFYENAFDSEGGRVSRAEEPRSVRAGLKYNF